MDEGNLSLIPYASDQHDIILRRGSAVVLYNKSSRQISLRNVTPDDEIKVVDCPYCGRPLETPDASAESAARADGDASFISPGYFRMLHQSKETGESQQTSRSPSPQLGLVRSTGSATLQPQEHSLNDTIETASVHRIPVDAFSQNYFKTFFVEERELGRGGNGVVLLVRHVIDNIDLGLFACKRVPVGDNSQWLRKVLVEVQLLQTLSHANLVSYKHVWLENYQSTSFTPSVPCAFILQQYCNSSDLHRYLFGSNHSVTKDELKKQVRTRQRSETAAKDNTRSPRHLPFEVIFSFFRDITSGLHYLHQNNYIHRDLKPSNCLLHTTGSQIRVLVSDFGEMQGINAIRRSTGHTGTISYCAPEVLQADLSGAYGNFSKKSDVFSLGLIVHLMCFGRLPYASADCAVEENEDLDQLRSEICAWTGMDVDQRDRTDLPERLYKFLRLLLSIDPTQRPSTEDILQSIKVGSVLHEQSQTRPLSNMTDDAEPADANRAAAHDIAPTGNHIRRRHSGLSITPEINQTHVGTHRPRSPLIRSSSSTEIIRLDVTANNPVPRSLETRAYRRRLLIAPADTKASIEDPFRLPNTALTWKMLFFCIKLYSCSRPCSPSAANAWITSPLLLLATFDFWGHRKSFNASLILLLLHLCAVLISQRFGMLCSPC